MKNSFLFFLCILMVSCASQHPDPADAPLEINEKTAPIYFSQFMYRVDGACGSNSSINSINFHWLTSLGDGDLGRREDGQEVYGHLELQLKPDGTYRGVYREQVLHPHPPQATDIETTLTKPLTGTWEIKGIQILFSNLGVGTPLKSERVNVIYTEFAEGFPLHGKKLMMGMLSSGRSFDEESAEDYCRH